MASLFHLAVTFILAALFMNVVFAHTYLSSVYLGNQALAEGDCVRPHPRTAYDSPIPLVTSPDMTCGWLPAANNPANRKCPIAAGSTIGLQWHHQSADPSDDIVDPTHAGPIIVYLAKSDSGAGNVWFKIYEDGYSGGRWGVDRMLDRKGRVDIPLPADIAPGNYLLRGEILALHGAYALNGVQPYVGCVELTISGSGKAAPSGVALPGYYKNTDPGMLFSRYQAFTAYIIPGPPVYVSSTGSAASSSGSGSASSSSGSASSASASSGSPSNPTTAPPSSPTSRPSSSNNGNIKVGLNSGTGVWWVGVLVSGGGETTVKVEMSDSGSFTNWVTMTDMGYSYVYSASSQVKAPISLRLTSSSGKQVVLTNVFSSLSTGGALIDSGKTYSSSSSQPQATPAPTKPTTAPAPNPTTKPASNPTTRPTTAPPASTPAPSSGTGAKVTVYNSATTWWFAVTISGASSLSKVELKDSGSRSAFAAMTKNDWGSSTVYAFAAEGTQLVAPITVRATSASGKTATATISKISGGATFDFSGSL